MMTFYLFFSPNLCFIELGPRLFSKREKSSRVFNFLLIYKNIRSKKSAKCRGENKVTKMSGSKNKAKTSSENIVSLSYLAAKNTTS
jgi:hypothetical protein